ncbi:hypothetical protein HJG54_06160 [Leptolyngbya sp. NK1-12]|uniref:Uncharacterized protein n=1 Tax=Leptolyngbya sp. NK1-12 TaxID=2547451 RepID=A0AA97AH78_9CYAN|nr:hypothetical protein [Leptolyngbya sp. NK1-12]WNZ22486.1 hypothetical protein HJG54_06160 [Leptolyngbya sp. NK1-12]
MQRSIFAALSTIALMNLYSLPVSALNGRFEASREQVMNKAEQRFDKSRQETIEKLNSRFEKSREQVMKSSTKDLRNRASRQ